MPNDPLRDSSARQDREETASFASQPEATPMQRRRERENARPHRAAASTKLFVLDTNVLMHDPTSLFRFEEHDIFLPMATIEELDANKKGMSEVARNARQVSRFLDGLLNQNEADIDNGIPLVSQGDKQATGRLFLQTQAINGEL